MIELTNNTEQVVEIAQPVQFAQVSVKSGCAERHRAGSGILSLTKPGRYLVTFSGNVAVPAGDTVGELAIAISLEGEAVSGTIMRATPAAIEQYFNVSSQTYIDVFCGCCASVSVKNVGDTAVNVLNPNLTAVRVCG